MPPVQTSEAYDTRSTVTAVETDAGRHIVVSTSCGHPFTYAGLHTPRCGEPLDCMTCHVEALERAEQEEAYVACAGCGLRNYSQTASPTWNCPDFPHCAEPLAEQAAAS